MLAKLKNNFIRFMQGRNGMDQLARAESGLIFVLLLVSLVISMFFGNSAGAVPVLFILEILWIVLFVHMYFRVFSRNLSKRSEENRKYCNLRYGLVVKKDRRKKEWAQRKTYAFFRCPKCRQRVRVPKGRGRICITCPKCRTEFTRRS
jgi:ribosomal protein L37AE/L43A